MASDEETRLMSRMLTQGATMLGEHCDGCGNPLFRVEGEEVCAVCSARDGEASPVGSADGSTDGPEEKMPEERIPEQAARGSEDVAEATEEVRRNLTGVVQRLSADAAEEQDVSRLNQQLDALRKAVDLLERL